MRITTEEGDTIYQRFRFDNRGSAADKYLRYPIDQAEVNKIVGLTGENWQNPGWLD